MDANGYQPIPEEYFVDSLEELISFVYDDGTAVADPEKAVKRLILAPTNEEVNEVNDILQAHLISPEKQYLGCDTPIGSKTHDPYYMGGLFYGIFAANFILRPPNRSSKQVNASRFYPLILC